MMSVWKWLIALAMATIQYLNIPIASEVNAIASPSGCVRFEQLQFSTLYHLGDFYNSPGVMTLVEDFEWSNGQRAFEGYAEIQSGGLAAGSGHELAIYNVQFAYYLNNPADHLTLRFGEYGGNLNITINSNFVNFEDFADLDGSQLGGVKIAVANGRQQ